MKLRLANLNFGTSKCVGICAVGPTDRNHPNKMPFTGTLLILDQASDKPPHGAEGHRIYVPSAVARKRADTILNMGINYSNELTTHAPQKKVGVITGVRIDGNKFLVNGFLWKRDFPKVEKDLHSGRLGMSMELQDVSVRDKNAPVWYLEDFHFSGATILYKTAAAYVQTSLTAEAIHTLALNFSNRVKKEISKLAAQTALAALAANVRKSEGGRMAKVHSKEKTAGNNGQGEMLVKAIAAGVAPAISAAIKESLEPFVGILTKQQKTIQSIAASVEETKTLSLEASKRDDETDEDVDNEEEVKNVRAAKHEDDDDDMSAAHHEDDDDDMEAHGKKKGEEDDNDEDEDDDAELDAEMENLEDDTADEDEPGELNKDAKNMGDKTTRTGKVGHSKSMKELVKASASKSKSIQASSVIRELYASHRALRKKYRSIQAKSSEAIETLQNKVDALEAQVETYANTVDRRSVSAELSNFMAKQNIDLRELRAEGRTLATGEIDQIFASAPVQLDPTTRMWFKNQLLEAGLMEQGEIHRGHLQ